MNTSTGSSLSDPTRGSSPGTNDDRWITYLRALREESRNRNRTNGRCSLRDSCEEEPAACSVMPSGASPSPARVPTLSYSSPLGRGGTAVLSGDGEGLHTHRDQRSWTHAAPVMNKPTLIASDAETLLPRLLRSRVLLPKGGA